MTTFFKNTLLLGIICLLGFNEGKAQFKVTQWKERDAWQNVPEIMSALNLQRGDKVADIGCHEGYLSMHLAKMVGKQGKVYSVDIEQYKLDKLNSEAEKRGHKNITTVLGAYDDPKLPKSSLDAIVVMRTYHEISSYMKYLKHLKEALKPGGKLVILESIRKSRVDWSRSSQTSYHELSIPIVKSEMKKAGFSSIMTWPKIAYWKSNKKRPLWMMRGTK
ncbi:MAG TPA: methyltransferase type 11 [Microscillaceae bacterium]|nr:methyltransferase type 11 [Microscillaceae bacterium]